MPTSNFTGGFWGYVGHSLLSFLLTVVTLGIATPWIICRWARWFINKTTLDGKQIYFEGKGGALFGRMLLWGLLTIVTLGIFSVMYVIKFYRWIISNTHFFDLSEVSLPETQSFGV